MAAYVIFVVLQVNGSYALQKYMLVVIQNIHAIFFYIKKRVGEYDRNCTSLFLLTDRRSLKMAFISSDVVPAVTLSHF